VSESGSENDGDEEEEDEDDEDDDEEDDDNEEDSATGYDTAAPSVSIAESEDADESGLWRCLLLLCLSDESMVDVGASEMPLPWLFADADADKEAVPMLRAAFGSNGFIGDAGGRESADDDDDGAGAFDAKPAPEWGDAADGAFDGGACCVLSTSMAPNISIDDEEEEAEERESSS
jgi:hypothetical protein